MGEGQGSKGQGPSSRQGAAAGGEGKWRGEGVLHNCPMKCVRCKGDVPL